MLFQIILKSNDRNLVALNLLIDAVQNVWYHFWQKI